MTDVMDIEIDVGNLLRQYERACAAVVEQGDSNLSNTTKERAFYRNEVRARLLAAAYTVSQPATREAANVAGPWWLDVGRHWDTIRPLLITGSFVGLTNDERDAIQAFIDGMDEWADKGRTPTQRAPEVTAETKLDEIAKLPAGWDGYGAPTPWPESVELARRLIRLFSRSPSVIPGSSGNVQLEWYGEGFEIEVYCHTAEDDFGTVTVLIEERTESVSAPAGRADGAE